MARRNSFLDFINSFNQGFDTINKVGKNYEMSQLSSEKETPEFTADQDAARAAMANAKDENGNPIYNFAADEQGNVSTTLNQQAVPGAAPEAYEPQAMAKGGTSYMGQSFNKPLSDTDKASARNMAMSGIMSKYGDTEGAMRMQDSALRMKSDAKRETQGDQRFEWEKTRNESDLRQKSKDEEYQTGRQEAFNTSVFGQKQAEFAQQLQSYSESKKAYDAALASGKQPQELGVPPQAPSRPAYTIADSLADQGTLLAHDAKFGKVDAKTFGDFTERMRKLEDEGYTKALTLAQGGATIEQVAQAFNASGQVKFDPKAIVSDKMMPGKAGGPPERVISFKDDKGNVQTINVMSELKSVGKANEVLTQFYAAESNRRGNEGLKLQQNQDLRAGAAEGRAAANSNKSNDDKAAQVAAGVALYKETNPNATPAQLEAVRTGILAAAPKLDANAPSEVKLAKAMVDAGMAGDMKSGLELALSKKGQSPEDLHQSFVAAGVKNMSSAADAVKKADETMVAMGYQKSGGRWRQGAAAGNTTKPVGEFGSAAEVEAAVKAGKVKPGDRVVVGGKPATWR